jgi:methionine-rich copper-binding protein CopC
MAKPSFRGTAALLGLVLVLVVPRPAAAHAILVAASPAARSTVQGPDVEVRLRFNSRIDGARSHLSLRLPGKGGVRDLPLARQDAPELLAAHAKGLTPGAYRLRWQVLASDGHITRGEIPFQVK